MSYNNQIIIIFEFLTLKRELDDILVMSECGKGKGVTHLCCPIIWNDHTYSNLYEDESYLQKENLSPNQVLSIFGNKFNIAGWDRITNLCKNAEVPYLYLEPKLKDVNKLRPLASYFRHPLKRVYKYGSMALLQILKNLSNTHHFNLF